MGGQKINYKKGYRINFLEVINKTNNRNTPETSFGNVIVMDVALFV